MSRPLVGEEICLIADDTTSRLLGVDNLLSSIGFANELGTRSDRARSRTELLPPPVFAHTDRPDETSREVHTFFSASIYLLMAITELPVRSCKAPTASLMSCNVAMKEEMVVWEAVFGARYERRDDGPCSFLGVMMGWRARPIRGHQKLWLLIHFRPLGVVCVRTSTYHYS
jgi:hypothetical protein